MMRNLLVGPLVDCVAGRAASTRPAVCRACGSGLLARNPSAGLDAYIDSLSGSEGSQPEGRMSSSRSPGSSGDAADGIGSTREEGA
jgi:hypothetical protein